jgi:hypothetical protein
VPGAESFWLNKAVPKDPKDQAAPDELLTQAIDDTRTAVKLAGVETWVHPRQRADAFYRLALLLCEEYLRKAGQSQRGAPEDLAGFREAADALDTAAWLWPDGDLAGMAHAALFTRLSEAYIQVANQAKNPERDREIAGILAAALDYREEAGRALGRDGTRRSQRIITRYDAFNDGSRLVVNSGDPDASQTAGTLRQWLREGIKALQSDKDDQAPLRRVKWQLADVEYGLTVKTGKKPTPDEVKRAIQAAEAIRDRIDRLNPAVKAKWERQIERIRALSR